MNARVEVGHSVDLCLNRGWVAGEFAEVLNPLGRSVQRTVRYTQAPHADDNMTTQAYDKWLICVSMAKESASCLQAQQAPSRVPL